MFLGRMATEGTRRGLVVGHMHGMGWAVIGGGGRDEAR